MRQTFDLVLLDASCLINLYATARLRDIALALPYPFGVAAYVAERETQYVWRSGASVAEEERVPVDLEPLVEEGPIRVMSLESEAEEGTFVDLASMMDDGEAVTGAIALHRGYAVATDDRKARRVLAERAESVRIVSTLELLKLWGETASVSEAELREALSAMESGASYLPGEREPLYGWWRAAMHEDGTA